MATINLGRVKGDPFRYEDFTPEQLAGLKGESFKFEDFTPEELESISAKVEVGTVTTLDAGEEATVTAKVEGNVTKLNFGIPQGEDAPTFTGTAAEYEAIADTIEDGTLINITDDFVEGETLDTHVLNKVDELEGKLDSSVKTRQELMANGEEGKLADALAIKETIKDLSPAILEVNHFATLEEFVIKTNTDLKVPKIGRFLDVNRTWGPSKELENGWYRFMIVYQNLYTTGTNNPVYGNGIFWNDDGNMWNVRISGNKDVGLTIRYEQVNKPTITNKDDLMANTVSGLFPDALAVKDAVNYYNMAKNRTTNIATMEEFLDTLASDVRIPRIGTIKDTGGWGPLGTVNKWYHIIMQGQTGYIEWETNPTTVTGFIFDGSTGKLWKMYIRGKKGETPTVKYENLVTTNAADDKVKTTTATIQGSTVAGELVYDKNIVDYYVTGNVLYLSLEISIKEVITHPEGEFRIYIDLPDVFTTKNLMRNHVGNLNVSYTKGGYKEGFRRIATANIIKFTTDNTMFLIPRQFTTSLDANLSPILTYVNFVNNTDLVASNDNKLCINDQNGNITDNIIQMHGSVLLKNK